MQKKTPKKIVVKKLDVHTNADVKRYIGAIAEHFGDQVSAVAEQFGSLNDKLDTHTSKLDVHTEMIGSIMEDVAIIKSDVEILKSGIRIKVDYKDFEALERRVRLVETKIRR